MSYAYLFVSLLLVSLLVYAGARKLSHRGDVVASYARVGVPEERLDALAAVLFVSAAGLVAGVFIRPLGIAAAAGLVIYFLAALTAHFVHRDASNAGTPLVMLVLAAGALVLRILVA
ncbi:MAG TPA: DoxX family protein [Longimicrobiales bacterium]|nr:DoxX family protein [Longimicrobiales bacterium]